MSTLETLKIEEIKKFLSEESFKKLDAETLKFINSDQKLADEIAAIVARENCYDDLELICCKMFDISEKGYKDIIVEAFETLSPDSFFSSSFDVSNDTDLIADSVSKEKVLEFSEWCYENDLADYFSCESEIEDKEYIESTTKKALELKKFLDHKGVECGSLIDDLIYSVKNGIVYPFYSEPTRGDFNESDELYLVLGKKDDNCYYIYLSEPTYNIYQSKTCNIGCMSGVSADKFCDVFLNQEAVDAIKVIVEGHGQDPYNYEKGCFDDDAEEAHKKIWKMLTK